jgi:formylglycine-generating enzyme required for sulfatase activity
MMLRLQKRFIAKLTALGLVFLFLFQNPTIYSQDSEKKENQLQKIFQWASMDYQKGKYWDVIRSLELLLTYFADEAPEENPQENILKGKTLLLLGATCEQLGEIEKAKEHYRLAKEILNTQKVKATIEGIDFSYLKEYQGLIMDKQGPMAVKPRIIEKPTMKRKKRGLSPLVIVGGLLVLGGAAAALFMKKKHPQDDGNNGNGDTGFSITWVQVPAGEFLMGDNFNEGNFDERPVHAVYLDEYYISKYEITFRQYDSFCETTGRLKPSDNGWGRGSRPVINISWGDAKAFCDWLSNAIHQEVRLPSEAQWEKAARGTDQRRYPWGNTPPDCNNVNYNCYPRTFIVGNYSAGISFYNAYDMAGNVSEWCRDGYDASYYSNSPYDNPVNTTPNPVGEVFYVIRGGSWDSTEDISIRATDRYAGAYYWGGSGSSDLKSSAIGFRVVYGVHSK